MNLLRCLPCAFCAVCWACTTAPTLRPLSPEARAVRLEAVDPPSGATPLGAIEASDGNGCGLRGSPGSLENAKGRLRETAARRGANYVKLIRIQEPYTEHECYHVAFKLEGLSFRLPGAATTPSAPRRDAAPGSLATAPCVQPAPVVAAVSSTPTACVPDCAPGYRGRRVQTRMQPKLSIGLRLSG